MSITAWSADDELRRAGYVLSPDGRYVDDEHGIDWAIIAWWHPGELCLRWSPGPGDPPHCEHGPMIPLVQFCRTTAA